MAEQQETFLDKSVTSADFPHIIDNNGVIRLVVPFWSYMDPQRIVLPPQAPAYWSRERDIVLRASVHNEAMWAAAVGIAITKMVSLAWEVKSSIPIRSRRAQDLLLQADTMRVGWVGFLSKNLRDYVSTDNGSFVEIVRASRAYGSQIVGLKHLDSLRTTRTGDPQFPVIYTDRMGRQHALRDFQVITMCDMPDPGESWNGTGLCAASRSYNAIYKLATIEWYLREKVGGLHPLAIYIVNGVLTKQMDAAIREAKDEETSKNVSAYMGAVIMGVNKENPPEVAKIPLAELPDRFDRKQEFDISLLTYADNLGLDPQELQPLSGQALGTGAQSQVLEDKQRGKGLAAWRQDFTHALNTFVLDDKTTFAFTERDFRDQKQKAEVQQARATVSKTRIDAGITSAAQELQILVDTDDLPKEFIPQDLTPGETVSDTDKPEQTDDQVEGAMTARPAEDAGSEKKPEQGSGEKPEAGAPKQEKAPKWGNAEKETDQPAAWTIEEMLAREKEYTGAMVALFLPKEIAEEIALDIPDALPSSDLHITLAYLGDTATGTMNHEQIRELVAHLAAESPAVVGTINGQGRFVVNAEEGANAHILMLDSPALPAFRQKIVDALKGSGCALPENHGFTPHITLVYNDDPTPPPVSLPIKDVKFPALVLAWGGARESFPFVGETIKASDESLDEAEKLLAKVMKKAKKRARKESGDTNSDITQEASEQAMEAAPTVPFDSDKPISPQGS